ncbi:cysteine-rich with EGF-like domain protein 2 [Pectinophora gossypiella]|uniref:cysteine-rich with EGF-like domain protein 2 n=1 Tax=Pectinophora gossypiella TaxID=13191 RepID=UPI00214F56AE|nr:cysteine-rich with EGF-like domain protein 2 [Pectinophora gossypiella]
MGIIFTVKFILFYLLIVCNLIYSKKLTLPELDDINSKKINECQRCKVLVDSFNYWFDKTSRGKFEGGDTAWEESKLRSYARSEIRLVEIQESLCSELHKYQDHCYSLTEEAEQPLEKWWLDKDPNSIDLHTWLCIENLKYCCPENHFGFSCEPCPLDKDNKLCGGHGRCNGEGTRKGNGSCECFKGFTGHSCGECAQNYYRADTYTCEPCHKTCDGCSGAGADACEACKEGWKLEGGFCNDIDECSDANTCKPNQFCMNEEGSYACKSCDKSCKTCAGPGCSNCTSCGPGAMFWSGVCVDSKLKDVILAETLNRVILYLGLLLIIILITKISHALASLVVLIVAAYIYYSEKNSTMNVVYVISNLYF